MHDAPSGAAARAAALVRPEIRAIDAYHVPPAAGLVKLDAMENPYDLPAALRERIARVVADVPVNRYPDGSGQAVVAALRTAYGIPEHLGVVLGNGSDELIQIITLALARPGAVMLAPTPTFVMYRNNALYAGMRFAGVDLTADFELDMPAMRAAIARERPALVFLAYPNNPTGNLFAPEHVREIITTAPGLVVIDEAYEAFAGTTFLQEIDTHPNVLVLRTVSKVGLAGLRLGYAVAARAWTDELQKLRPPYNVNALTQAVAPLVLAERALLDGQAAAIRSERERLGSALARLPGVAVWPSRTNFVLIRVPDANAWHAGLRGAGILVKNVHGTHPLLTECLRVTVGTPQENDALLAALERLA